MEWLHKTYPPGQVPRTWINFEDLYYHKPEKWAEPFERKREP